METITHPVPDSVLEAQLSILGQTGSGKSVTAKGLVERLLDRQRRVIILDPLNHWYGLKAKADGSAGYPIVVIGGPQGDISLDVKGGALLGEVLAGEAGSFVLDMSDLVRSELVAFSTAFLTALYKNNRQALWLIAEEGDIYAPQNPAMDGTRAMADAMDQIARRGRQRGFRLWTLTQRPARLAKDCLTQASALILMRLRSPQDRGAAEDWIKGHAEKAQAKEVVDSLAALEVGQGWLYAPDLSIMEKVRFPLMASLDTSKTPDADDVRAAPVALASVDVEALRLKLDPPKPSALPLTAKGILQLPPIVNVDSIRTKARADGYTEGYQAGHAEGARVEREVNLSQLRQTMERIAGAEIAASASQTITVRRATDMETVRQAFTR